MMNEIENLRGTEVLEFGQPKQMQAEFDPLIIDTVGILEELEGHEVSSLAVFDPETDEEIYFDNASEYLDYMDEVYGLEELSHDNTFNYNSPISNQIDYQVYKDDYRDSVLVEMKTQLGYGDVRAHYTDSALLEFESVDHFYETFLDAGHKEVEFEIGGNEFTAQVNALNSNIEVFEYGTQVL